MNRGYTYMGDEKEFGLPTYVVFDLADGTQEIHSLKPCNHQYRKTEPSLLNAEGILLWRCVFCNKTTAST